MNAADLPVLRAAYSDRSALLMSTLSRLAYDFPPTGCAPGPCATTPQEFVTLGFDRITYFHNGLIDGWAYLVEGPNLVAIAFRGTKSPTNWGTNFQVGMLHPPTTDAHLLVHEGFYRAFRDLSGGTHGLQESVDEVIARTKGQKPIYVTGHSLGGALAQIATAVFGCDQLAACYTFGSPRVGNAYFDLWVKPPSYRIENYADLVPQSPFPIPYFYPYRHAGDPRYLQQKVDMSPFRYEPHLLVRLWQLALGIVEWFKSGTLLGIADHNIALYEKKLAAIAAARSQSR
jgi:triacylglycerol lipase